MLGRLTSPFAQKRVYRRQGLEWRFSSATLMTANDTVMTQNGKRQGGRI